VTLAPPPISRPRFRNRPISKPAGFETGVAERALCNLASAGFETGAERALVDQ
jgi:hypothetical protein